MALTPEDERVDGFITDVVVVGPVVVFVAALVVAVTTGVRLPIVAAAVVVLPVLYEDRQ